MVAGLEDDCDRLEVLHRCPALFQRRVQGVDVRVHTVGRQWFPVEVRGVGTDYRYDRNAEWRPADIPSDIGELCARAAERLGLGIGGWDFKRTADGRWVCLEVNPMPAFNVYDVYLDNRIVKAIAEQVLRTDLSGAAWMLPTSEARQGKEASRSRSGN